MKCNGSEDYLFGNQSFDTEISRKLVSAGVPPERLFQLLMQRQNIVQMSNADKHKLVRLEEVLCGLHFESKSRNYLNHPIRVAASYADRNRGATYGEISLALTHNIRELSALETVTAVPGLLNEEVVDLIDLLTIDRNQERDRDYLVRYYERIEEKGSKLVVLKALDKLDNLLEWVNRDVEPFYYQVISDFVCPAVNRYDPALSRYMWDLLAYVTSGAARRKLH